MTYTPGQAAHDSLRDSAPAAFGRPASDFATWDQLPPDKQERMADAGRKEIAAYIEANGGDPVDWRALVAEAVKPAAEFDAARLEIARLNMLLAEAGNETGALLAENSMLDRALSIAAHEAELETADADAARERWLWEARLQEAMFGAQSSAKGQRPEDQPLPKPGTGPSMHDLVIGDLGKAYGASAALAAAALLDRKRLGLERYGQLLQANNGRDALRDLLEELQDASVYCRQVIEENRLELVRRNTMRVVYDGLLTMLLRVTEARESLRPSPGELWQRAGGDRDEYRRLLREHGHILAPGDAGYDPDAPRTLPCGWSPDKPKAAGGD